MRQNNILPAAATLVLTLALGLPGCSAEDNTGSCERIAEACHDKDTGSGEPHECHELAESGDGDDVCAEKEDDCLAACEATE